jgi:restriction endonuclease
MKNLNYYKEIMQDKSKNLSFSDYLKYITSWQELNFYKID